MPTAKNLDIYGDPTIEWSRAVAALEDVSDPYRTCWLATTDADGRAHLAGVGALWVDEKFYFTTSPRARKTRNIKADPRCAMSVHARDMDIVVEGTASHITDQATLDDLCARYVAQGWPARVENGSFTAEYSAPSAYPPPWDLYAITPENVYALASSKPYGATRWRFS